MGAENPDVRYPNEDDPVALRLAERNAFYGSLSSAAQTRFLDALKLAEARGLSEEAAWREAVIAAETTYAENERAVGDALPPVKDERVEP